jgi:hypothetical protein
MDEKMAEMDEEMMGEDTLASTNRMEGEMMADEESYPEMMAAE